MSGSGMIIYMSYQCKHYTIPRYIYIYLPTYNPPAHPYLPTYPPTHPPTHLPTYTTYIVHTHTQLYMNTNLYIISHR